MIQAYDSLLVYCDSEDRKGFSLSIGPNWEEDHFGHGIPLIVALTTLTKIEANIDNLETNAVKETFSLADHASGCKLDRYEVVVIPSSCVISVGEKYHAEIILTLRTDFHPEMVVKGKKIEVVDDEGVLFSGRKIGRSEEVEWCCSYKANRWDYKRIPNAGTNLYCRTG